MRLILYNNHKPCIDLFGHSSSQPGVSVPEIATVMFEVMGTVVQSGCRPATRIPSPGGRVIRRIPAHHRSDGSILSVLLGCRQAPAGNRDEKRGRREPLPAIDQSRYGST